MAAPAILLGLDVGRDGLGMVAITGDGKVLASLRRGYAVDADGDGGPGASDWWRAARTGFKELLRRAELRSDQVRAIGLSGDGDALVAVDRNGDGLATCPAGADPRFAPFLDEAIKLAGARNFANLTGSAPTTASGAVKLLWLQANHKRAWHDCALVLPPKDYLRLRLTGTVGTDATDACATSLYNPRTRSWSKQLLQLLSLNHEWLPQVGSGASIAGRVTDGAARDSGLQSGTPVVTGAGHASALAVAAGVIDSTSTLVELGDGGSVFAPTTEPMRDLRGRLRTGCHTLPGLWTLQIDGGASSAPLDWILDQVMPSESAQARRNGRPVLELLAELAAEIPPGADGLVWLPGSGNTPGGCLGLTRQHGRGHLARAAFEGGALACRTAVEAADSVRGGIGQVVLAGRGASSPLWAQVVADGVGRPVQAITVEEPAAVGAAILAANAIGHHKVLGDAIKKMAGKRTTYSPRRASADVLAATAERLTALRQTWAAPPAFEPAMIEAAS